jgi:AhpD family alkylhydroperoxidase
MMLDWNAYAAELGAREGMSLLAPNAVTGFIALDKGANKTTHLDAKTRELIAVAIAVTTRCDGCIGVRTERAIKAGATREEVAEALGVAIAAPRSGRLSRDSRALHPARQASH